MDDKKVEMDDFSIHLPEGTKELVIRKGDALPLANPRSVSIDGTISAPGKFITERNADFNKNKSHCLVSREGKVIVLHLDESNPFDSYSITGRIKLGNKFTSLAINNSEGGYSPEALSKKLKLLRSIFPDNGEHAKIVASLKNLKAKVNQEINKDNDGKGNVKVDFTQTVESNMPDKFTLNLPLLEGEKSVKFDVNVILEATSSHDIQCFLESVDAAEMIEKEVDKRIDEEIKIIEPFAVVIEK